jgi:hypothetical protein
MLGLRQNRRKRCTVYVCASDGLDTDLYARWVCGIRVVKERPIRRVRRLCGIVELELAGFVQRM